jgi:hypothetical protein
LSQTLIVDKFIRGLKPKTRIEVELRDPKTPDEAYRLADRFDRIVYGVKSTSFLTQNYNRYSPTSNTNGMNTDYGEPMHIDALTIGSRSHHILTEEYRAAASKVPYRIMGNLRIWLHLFRNYKNGLHT